MENEEKNNFSGKEGGEESQNNLSGQNGSQANPGSRPSTTGIVGKEDSAEDISETPAEKYDDFAKEAKGEWQGNDAPEKELVPDSSFLGNYRKSNFKDILVQNKSKLLIAAVVIVFLILVAITAFYIMGNRGGHNSAPAENQNTIVESSFEAMKGITSYSYNGKVKIDYSLKENDAASGTYGISSQVANNGVAEYGNQENPSYSSFGYDTTINSGNQKNETVFNVEEAFINNKEYIRLGDFNGGKAGTDTQTASLQNVIKDSKGVWYSMTPEDSKQFAGIMKNYYLLPTSFGSAEEIDKTGANSFGKIFSQTNLLTFSQDLGDEKVDETDAVHYKLNLNTKEALSLINSFAEEASKQENLDANTKKFLEDLKSETQDSEKLKQVADYVVKDVNFEVWIGKNDKFIHRFKINGSFNRDFVKGLAGKLKEVYGDSYSLDEKNIPEINLSFDIDYTLSKFNASKVREPEGAKEFKEILGKISAVGPLSLNVPTSSSTTDTDGDGLSDDMEKIFGTDPNKADTDGDGYKDGDEVKNGYDPAVSGSARLDYSKLNAGK